MGPNSGCGILTTCHVEITAHVDGVMLIDPGSSLQIVKQIAQMVWK